MRRVWKGTRSAGLSPDCPKGRATCEEAEATSRADSYWVPATYGESVAAGVGLLGSVETVSELGDRSGYDRCPGPVRLGPIHILPRRQ